MKDKAFLVRLIPWPLVVNLFAYLALSFPDGSPLFMGLRLVSLGIIGLAIYVLLKNRGLSLKKALLAYAVNMGVCQLINKALVGLPSLTRTDPLTGRIHSWEYAIDVFASWQVIGVLLVLALVLDSLFILSHQVDNRK